MSLDFLKIGTRITAVPVIHGSGDFAVAVRRLMLEESFDCVAVPLPESFQKEVEQGVQLLPTPTVVTQKELPDFQVEWSPEQDNEPDEQRLSYVPIDPCQPVIAALRNAIGEHIPRRFIDLETAAFRPDFATMPDPYALKEVRLDRFAAALLPTIQRPPEGQTIDRCRHMASRLRELEQQFESILFVCSVLDWPWIREAFVEKTPVSAEHDDVEPSEHHDVDIHTLTFMLGELPFITALYEAARAELEDDDNLSIDGVKALLIAARDTYKEDYGNRALKISPQTLKNCLKYIRNLSLLNRRLTPDLYTIIVAAKQTVGDGFALHVAERSRDYRFSEINVHDDAAFGIGKVRLPGGEVFACESRLPGHPMMWGTCELKRRPDKTEQQKWKMQWNPLTHCSWPPEDELIENFRSHVLHRANLLLGADLVKTEKFTTSIKDGIDIRDTLRNWHTGEIYVRDVPPARGTMDAVVMLFDSPADPRDYPWRTTWFAEHENESTLSFFASNYMEETIGPGIGLATYGGAMFLFPPRPIIDIWTDPRLDFTETLEERVLAAACIHAESRQIALLSPAAPGTGWKSLAKRFGKRWVHVPLAQFSESTVQQLRMVHVLNGHQVRSYASDFIRRS